MSVVTEKSLAEAAHKVSKIFAGKCMNEHAARSILSNIIHLVGSKADINECEVKYHRGKYLNSFFIKIRENSILFAIDMAEGDRIEKFDYTETTFIQWLNENSKEMKPMEAAKKHVKEEANVAKPFLEILGEMQEGDVIIHEASVVGIIRSGCMFYYYDTVTREQHDKIVIDVDAIHTKYKFYDPYVSWKEAFEVYEKGGTIECEWQGEMVWFNRSITSLEESSMLADKQLDGLLETKWIIKSNPKK